MRHFLCLISFVCAAVVFTPAAQADFTDPNEAPPAIISGADLIQFCASPHNTDYGFCTGYITAVAEQMKDAPVAGLRACNFGAARSQQFVDLFKSYAAGDPDAAQMPAQAAAAHALARAFPCPQ